MFKKIIAIVLLGTCFLVTSVSASNKLELEFIDDCVIQYTGDSCSSEVQITNNTNEIFDGTVSLTMYQQDILFDGEGINITYDNTTSTWKNGTLTFPVSVIKKGIDIHTLKIKTHPALVPDYYSFGLTLIGNINEEVYSGTTGGSSGGGGGGGWIYIAPTTQDEISSNTDITTQMTETEIKAKIKEIQQQLIILIYKLIIEFMKQLVALG